MLKSTKRRKVVTGSRLIFWGVGCVLAAGMGALLYGVAARTVDDDAAQIAIVR